MSVIDTSEYGAEIGYGVRYGTPPMSVMPSMVKVEGDYDYC